MPNVKRGGRLCSALLAVILALGLGTTARAQPRNPYGGGTRLPEESELRPVNVGFHHTRVVLKQFSECLVKKRPVDVQRYLLEDVGENEIVKLRMKVLAAGPDCLRADELQLLPLTLQGALADVMLRDQKLLNVNFDVVAIPPLHHDPLNEESLHKLNADSRQKVIAMDYLFRFGECVVRGNAGDSRALANSEPDSPEETDAFGRLMPAFGNCIEKNRTLQGDKIEIRAAVVYEYYRLAAAAHPENLFIVSKT